MKELYFDTHCCDQQAVKMLGQVQSLRNRHEWRILPDRIALLIIDMQNYFLDPSSHAFIPSSPVVVNHIEQIQKVFHQLDIPVIQSRHLNTTDNCSRLAEWWRDTIARDDPGSQLCPRLCNDKNMVIEKSQYDCFYKTDLERILHEKGIEQLVISGVMTHLCCETTARSAFVRGFQVFFVIDGTATYNRDFHLGTLRNLAHGFAIPILTKEILKLVEKK